jgi:hypothetical protein
MISISRVSIEACPFAREPVDDRPEVLRRQRTPGGAAFVEDDGLSLFDRGHIQEELVASRRPLGGVRLRAASIAG